MRSRIGKTTLSVLAAAITTAIIAIPAAHSGGKPLKSARGAPVSVDKTAGKEETYDGVIISYHKGQKASAAATDSRLRLAERALGVKLAVRSELATGARLVAADRKLDRVAYKRLVNELMKDPSVRAVDPNGRMQRAAVPNDPAYAQQWHYKNGVGGINLEPAWDVSTGEGVVVAVLDTGSTPHADLAGQWVPGYDFVSAAEDARDNDGRDANANDEGDWHDGECNIFGIAEDSSWHGTHVAGTVAAATNNNLGVAGVAYGAKVQPVRVLAKCGGTYADIADAIIWSSGGTVAGVPANATPADVINLSLGGGGACSTVIQDAINTANANGSLVVVAAGNSGANVSGYQPASCNGVVAVSATTPTATLASYSNFGLGVSVAAPGGTNAAPAADNILSTLNDGLTVQEDDVYAWYAGTSMAAPHVAGVAALMLSAAEGPITPAQAKKILENTAYAANGFVTGCAGSSLRCGAGIIDAELAVAVAAGDAPLPEDPPPPPPPPPPVVLQNGVTVSGISVAASEERFFTLTVPAGATQLKFNMVGTTGDADLYVRFGSAPTTALYDCRPYGSTSTEECAIPTAQAGVYHVMIRGYTAAPNLSITGSYTAGSTPPSNLANPLQSINRRGQLRIALTWDGGVVSPGLVDIYRNDVKVGGATNVQRYSDAFVATASGSATYKVCNAGSTACTAPLTVNYTVAP